METIRYDKRRHVYRRKRKGNGKRRAWTSKWSRAKKRMLIERLLVRDGYACGICGESTMLFDITDREHTHYRSFDHIVSPNDGGDPEDINNLRLAHQACNNRRQNGHPNGS